MADADRDHIQLIKEKEALLQDLQLISQQRRPPEDLAKLEEEKGRLADEIQRARFISTQGVTERFVLYRNISWQVICFAYSQIHNILEIQFNNRLHL